MAITIDQYSQELTTVRAEGNSKLAPNVDGGRMRIKHFNHNTNDDGVSGDADGQNIALCKIPKGARVLEVFLAFEAMGGSSVLDLGLAGTDGSGFIDEADTVADDDDLFAAALSVVSAGEAVVADTIAQNYAYETDKEVYLVATVETDAWDADKDLTGHVVYVVD